MRGRWQWANFRAALRRNWQVRPATLVREDSPGPLEVRVLEQRRVLSASAALAMAQALAASGMEQVEATAKSPDPATPLGTDAAHQQPIDPGDRVVPGKSDDAGGSSDEKGPAAENLLESENRSVTGASSDDGVDAPPVEAAVATPLALQARIEFEVAGDQTTTEGTTLTIEDIGKFTDYSLSADEYTYTIDWGDGHIDSGIATIDDYGADSQPRLGSFDGSHTYADNGLYTITIMLDNGDGTVVFGELSVRVHNVDPTLTVVADQVVNEGQTLSITDLGAFTDPGFDNPLNIGGELTERFTYSIDWGDGTAPSSGPATIDVPGGPGTPTKGSFDGSHTYADNGIYTFTVTLNDDDGGIAVQTFQVTVRNVDPTLTVVPDQVVNEGELLSITDLGKITDPAFDNPLNIGGELSEKFTYFIDWGDGTPGSNGPVTIDVPGGPGTPTQGSFDGSHIYADNGVYTVTVTVNDDDGGVAVQTFTVVVNNVAPVLTVVPDQVVNEGELLSLTDLGVFTDPGFDNPLNIGGELTERFTYSIDWGDGTPPSSGPATIDIPGGPGTPTQGSFNGSHTYADNGVYTVTVTLNDDDGGIAVQTFTVVVNNVAPVLTVVPDQVVKEGELLSLTDLGVFTDPGFDNPLNIGGELTERFTYSIDWGDGTPPSSGPATIDIPGGPGTSTQGSFDGSHIYADNGVYTVTVTINDDDGGVAVLTFTVVVNNVDPVLIVPGDQVVDEGELLSLPNIGQYSDPGFDNPLNIGGELTERFTYSIDWGDGSMPDSGPAPINVPGGPGVPTSGSFGGSHTYQLPGTYTVTVTLNDDDGGVAVGTFQVTVRPVAPVLITAPDQVIDEGSLLTVMDIGQFVDPRIGGADFYTYTIDWGDGTAADGGTATIDGGGDGPLYGSFDGSHTYADNGLYTVVVTITTSDGRTAIEALQVLVNNVAPTLTVGPDVSVPLGTLLVLNDVGLFTDPGFDNPLNIGGELTERFTFSIDWGDGLPNSAGPATIDTPGAVGLMTSGSFDASHLYAAPGEYTVTVTLSDDDGGSAVATFQVTVFVLRPPGIVTFPPGGGGGPTAPAPPTVSPGDPRIVPPNVILRHDLAGARTASVAGAEPRLVIRIVTPDGHELREAEQDLPEDVLDDLRALFRRLPDGHYRIYEIQPDGIERLVVDVIVREGRSIELPSESTPAAPAPADGPMLDTPHETAPAAEQDESNTLPAPPQPAPDMHSETRQVSVEPPIAAAGLMLSLPVRRAQRAAQAVSRVPRFTKFHRILRRSR